MTQIPTKATGDLVRPKEATKLISAAKAKPVFGVVHRMLRTATLEDHAAIDRMLLPFDLNKPEDCRVFLNIHFAALDGLQADWRLQDREDFRQMVRCIQLDLTALGSSITTSTPFSGESSNFARGLGTAYVIRGSRLGARALRRRIVSALPTSYLDFVPALPWEAFLVELESIADDPAGRNEAARAACSAFDAFAKGFADLSGVLATPTF